MKTALLFSQPDRDGGQHLDLENKVSMGSQNGLLSIQSTHQQLDPCTYN